MPPTEGPFSTRWTSYPPLAISNAACIPAMPAPMIRTAGLTGECFISSGSENATFATAAAIKSFAFCVPFFLSLCTQEHCSLIFATSSINGFNPADSSTLLNVILCRDGVQEATTTLFRLYSFISCLIKSCPGSEHIYT